MRFTLILILMVFETYGQSQISDNHICNDSAIYFLQRAKDIFESGRIPIQSKIRELRQGASI